MGYEIIDISILSENTHMTIPYILITNNSLTLNEDS